MAHARNGQSGWGAGGPARPGARVPRRSWGTTRFFLVCWIALMLAGSAWTLTTPLFGAPDEPAQVVRAVAAAHGEFVGRTVEQHGGGFAVLEYVKIPAYYQEASVIPQCFAFKADVPAGCAPAFRATDHSLAEVSTYVGLYPPLYYTVVGTASLVLDGAPAVYAMRAISVLICSAALAVGMTALRRTRLPRPALAAGLMGISPAVLFFAAVVNPSGLEIAAGFATWALLLPLVLDPGAHHVKGRLLAGAAAAVVLVNTRPASGLLAVLICVILALVAARGFWTAVRSPRVWAPGVALAAAGGAIALAWVELFDPARALGGIPVPALADPRRAAVDALMQSRAYLEQQIGTFGWLDTPSPLLTVVAWVSVLAAVVIAALAIGRPRGRIAVLVCLALIVAVPVVSQVPYAARLGLGWQGRYLLPYSTGLPLLAYGVLLERREGRRLGHRLVPVVVVLTAIGQIAAQGWTLWRFSYGLDRIPLASPPRWVPPSGLALPLVLMVAAMAGLAWVVIRAPAEVAVSVPLAHREELPVAVPETGQLGTGPRTLAPDGTSDGRSRAGERG